MKWFITFTLLAVLLQLLTPAFTYFDIDVQKHEQLSETTYMDFSQLKIRKENRTRKIFGNIYFHVDINASVLAQVNFFKKQGGEYRLTPFRTPEDSYCNFLKNDLSFYPDLSKTSDFPNPPPCPLPSGLYAIRGYTPSLRNVLPGILKTGDYMAETNLKMNNVIYLKWRLYSTIIRI